MDASLLDRMTFAFVTNAAVGVRAVRSIDQRKFAEDAPILELLRSRYRSIPAEKV